MKKILAIFSLTLLAAFSFAQNEQSAGNEKTVTLSIDEAVDYALKNSRTLKSNDIDLEIKKRASDVSWNVFLPAVSMNGTMMRSNEISPSYANYGISDYPDEESRWDVIGGASVSWNFTPAYIAQIQIAKANYESGKITWEQSQNETVLNIKKLYYALLLQQESLKIQQQTLENARQRMIQAEANFKSGLVPEISLLQTQVNYENTKPDVDSAVQSLNQQFDTFAFLLGLPVGTKIQLTSPIEPTYVDVETQDLLNKYAENDLQLKSLKKNMETAKLGVKALDLSTWVPTFALSYGWTPMYTDGSSLGLAAQNAKAFGFLSDLGKNEK